MTAHREGAWSAKEERPLPMSSEGRTLRREVAVLAGATALVGALASTFGAGGPFAGVVVLVGGFGLVRGRASDRRRAALARATALRDEFGPEPAWTVDLMVRQGEAPTGVDQGLLWVEEGRILFSGLRTSFALAPDQTVGRVGHDAAIAGIRHRLNLRLAREAEGGPLSLSFWPIALTLQNAEEDAASLRHALNAALDQARGAAEGQWPPTTLGPGALVPRVVRRAAVVRIVGWTVASGLGSLLFLPNVGEALAFFLAVAAGLNAVVSSENAPRWAAYRDAKRVRRSA